jgi:hypothetical protein
LKTLFAGNSGCGIFAFMYLSKSIAENNSEQHEIINNGIATEYNFTRAEAADRYTGPRFE